MRFYDLEPPQRLFSAGELTKITYPSGRVVNQEYDTIGRLSAVKNGTSPMANAFAYNTAGQVTGFQYNNDSTFAAAFTYSDDRLQLTAIKYMKNATKLLDLAYGYGAAASNNGQITGISDNTGTQEAGRSVTYTYDALHRLKTAETAGSTDYAKWGLTWTYDRYGNRTNQAIVSGCVAPMQCPTNPVTMDPATNRIVDPGHTAVYPERSRRNAANRVISAAGTRRKVEYEYDANAAPNIVRDITVTSADFKYVDSTTYSNLGLMEKMVYGNGLETMVGWNKRGQISAIDTREDLGGGAFDHRFQLSYAYYGNGQIQQILNLLAAGNLKDEKYTYDEVGRLASAQRGPDYNIQRKFEYVYDRWGNRWDQNKVAGPYGTASHKTFDITTAKDNRLIDPNHTYDLSGNLTASGSGTSFGYNPESFMTTATTLTGSNTSARDAQGRRVKKTVTGTETLYFYIGAEIIAEKTGATWTDYIFFVGQRIAQNTGSTHSTAVYLHTDHLGSTRLCTNASGDSSGTCDYEPFGEVQAPSGCSVPTKFRFAGMEFDDETQLYHTWFRSYDPSQGRWMSVDPLPGHPEDPQTLNRYVYVRNDPVNLIDPFGLDIIVIEYECLVRINPDGSREYIECEITSITVYQTGSTPTLGGGGVQLGGSSSGDPDPGGGVGGATGTQVPPQPQQQPCVQPNFLQRAVITGLGFWASLTGRTIGLGAGGSAGVGHVMGNSFNVSRQLVVSPNGQAGFVDSNGTNAFPLGPTHGAGAIGGLQVSVSNARNPQQLAGLSVTGSVGGGAGAGAALDVSVGTGGIVQTTVTLGGAAGGVGQAGTINASSVTPICPPR